MNANRTSAIAVFAVALALASDAALAAPALLSTDYRYASQADKTSVRGGGTVSESKLLPRGLRLAAPEAKGEGEVAATAIYLFKVPLAAAKFDIEVGYRADAQAKDKAVAGFLFVRDSGESSRQPIEPQNRPKPKEAQPAFSGNLYFLKADETTASVTLPFAGYVVDGVLEIHLTAGAGQAFDAQYVQVAAHRGDGGYLGLVGYRVPEVPSGRANDPLNYQQRPPRATHGVPNLYPNLYGAGHADSQDPIFWHQVWQMQRPHLYNLYPYPYPYHGGHRHKPHKK